MSKKRWLAIAMSLVMVFSLIPHNVFAAAQTDNSWQIVSGLYQGNAVANKQTSNDEVRIQKNVIPTAVENEFQVYLAVDALCSETKTSTAMTATLNDETLLNSLYTGGSANGFPDCYDGQEHEGNGALSDGLKGSAKPCDPGDTRFKLVITYEKDGHTYTIAEPILSLGVPNSVLYLKVGDDFVCLENINGKNMGSFATGTDEHGTYYIVPVHLTSMAYNAIMGSITQVTTTTTHSLIGDDGQAVTITDPMGGTNSYIVYDGFVSGDIAGTAPAASSEPGGTINWQIQPKAAPAKPEVPSTATSSTSSVGPTTVTEGGKTTTTTITRTTYTWTESGKTVTFISELKEVITEENGTETVQTFMSSNWWAENMVELTYKVHLAVDKEGFTSGTEYPTNGATTLNYGDGKSIDFTSPVVKGTLYDFSFTKTDGTNPLAGAVFTLVGPSNNPDVASTTWPTVTSGTDGKVSFTGLPWGTYTLSETPPSGYTGAADMTLNIGYTNPNVNITHNETANDVYKLNDSETVINTKNVITVTKTVSYPTDFTADDISHVDHTVYVALWDRTNNTYWKQDGQIVYQQIVITDGVPSPASFTFEGVPAGSWSVWELASAPGATDDTAVDLTTHTVVYDDPDTNKPDIELSGINTTGNVTFPASGTDPVTVGVTNTYGYHSGNRTVEVNKAWATYSGTAMAAPEGASVIFTLYRKVGTGAEEEVSSVTLNGTPDENGESEAWKATWTVPLLDNDSHPYTYMVKETVPEGYVAYVGNNPMGDGYQTNVSGGTITNRKQTTDVVIKKEVSGYNTENKEFTFSATYDGLTAPITFSLKNGETRTITDVPVGKVLTVTETDNTNFDTSITWTDTTQHTVTEKSAEITVAEPMSTVLFTNTRQIGSLKISKTVESDLAADQNTSFTFTVTLKDANGTALTGSYSYSGSKTGTITSGGTVTLSGGQSITITGLPAGATYAVVETAAEGFGIKEKAGDTGTISATTLSEAAFTNAREVGDLTVSKTVNSPIDADHQKEFPITVWVPASLNGKTYTLVKGETSSTVTVTNGTISGITLKDGESVTIKGLPTNIDYTVFESGYEDFTPSPVNADGAPQVTGSISKDGATVAFTNTRKTVDVTGAKIWADSDYVGQTGYTRPASIEVTLTGTVTVDGNTSTVSTDTKTVTANDSWAYSWTGLPETNKGNVITYTVTETVPEGYTASFSGYSIINTPVDKKDVIDPVSLTIKKTDANTGNGLAGAVFTAVDGEGKQVATATSGADGTATLTFTIAGTFTMTETAPTGYIADPGSWTIKVTQSGVDKVQYNAPNAGVWNWFYHLLFSDGTDYANGTLTVPNTPKPVDITATKVWNDNDDADGKRPASVTLRLYADGADTGKTAELDGTVDETAELEAWKATFKGLPSYKDGKEIVYTVDETAVPADYTKSISADGLTVTNSHQSSPVKTVFTGSSTTNIDGKTVTPGTELTYEIVYVNTTGATVAEVTITDTVPAHTTFVSANNGGTESGGKVTWKFTNVADGETRKVQLVVKVDADASETVDNTAVVNDGTNSYNTNEVINYTVLDITVNKVWEDENNKDGVRPDSITVKLLADGADAGVEPLTLNEGNKWTGAWTGMPKSKDGKDITYTVEELTVESYATAIEGDAENGFTITNTHVVLPPTGDDANLVLWTAVLAAATICLAVMVLPRFKRRKK